jgi:hypothetical protein
MQNIFLSNWVRQLRYKARHRGVTTDISIEGVKEALDLHKNECIYCGCKETTPDLAYNLKDNAPAIPANVVPVCKECRGKKKFNDILWMYLNGYIPQDRYVQALKIICQLDSQKLLTDKIKSGLKGSD